MIIIVLRKLLYGICLLAAFVAPAYSRDLEGKHSNDPLKPWFDSLKNKSGVGCCADADGAVVKDVDWSAQGEGQECQRTPMLDFQRDGKDYVGHFCVRYKNIWWLVPDSAVINDPNRFGLALIWPICTMADTNNNYNTSGADACKEDNSFLSFIRCFIPGAGT